MAEARIGWQFNATSTISCHNSSVPQCAVWRTSHEIILHLMENLNLIVISPPNARYLSLLEKLPPTTRITVGRTPEAFETAAVDADVVMNGMNVGDTLKRIWKDLAKVKWVHSLSAGLDATLFPELVESHVPITNSRGVFKRSLAEFAICGMPFFAQDFRRMLRNQAAARWEQFDVEELY